MGRRDMRTVQRLINLMRTMEPGHNYRFMTDGPDWYGVNDSLQAIRRTLKRARPVDYRLWSVRDEIPGESVFAEWRELAEVDPLLR